MEEHVKKGSDEEGSETDRKSVENKDKREDGVPEESASRYGDEERKKGGREETQEEEREESKKSPNYAQVLVDDKCDGASENCVPCDEQSRF